MDNIILTGMPGCGKSTVGVILAKIMGYDFLDADLLIQKRAGMLLHEIISEKGEDAFLRLENEVNSSVAAEKTVIATGGSVVLCKDAMEHFKAIGKIAYIRLPLELIEKRVGSLSKRGVVRQGAEDLAGIYAARTPLYEKYADVIIDVDDRPIEEQAKFVLKELRIES
ncbi:MAG: shikimate kinase [Oscillospiraceae bacterium]|nr:shikimate kinase [Oscillospiraceae bacterium]